MTCFNLLWLEALLIWLIVIGAVFAIIRVVVPLIVGPLGVFASTVVQILNIVLWVVVAIAVVYLVFDLLGCVIGFPRMLR